MTEPRAVQAAIAALLEANRPDLAVRVVPNRLGFPMLDCDDCDQQLVARAFLLGHQAIGHPAYLVVSDEGVHGFFCDICSAMYE